MPDISRSERGSVVDTVASHRHDAFAGFELEHFGLLLRRSNLGHDLVNPESAGNLTGGLLVVARQHDNFEAGAMQIFNGFRRAGLDRIRNGEQTCRLTLDPHPDDSVSLPLKFVRERYQAAEGCERADLSRSARFPTTTLWPVTEPCTPPPGEDSKFSTSVKVV